MASPGPKQPHGAASFLLAQVGAHAAMRFAERLAGIGVSPPEAGLLRTLAGSAGLSQQRLSETLGIHPSRLVSIVDDLESRHLVERRENADDRRSHALHLTDQGRKTLGEIAGIAREHNAALMAALSSDEREELARLLGRIAEQQGLKPGVHPGFARMGPPRRSEERER